MSLEFVLDKYPIKKSLIDGLSVSIRPLRPEDEEAIKEFYPVVPEHERMFIKHPVTDMTIFTDWCRNIDYERNFSLLAFAEKKVIAEGTLHRRNGGWKKHIGLISILTHPDFRARGLSELLVAELVVVARFMGLSKLETELNGEREIAIKSFAKAGFRQLVRLPDYLQDMQARRHDYVLMGMDLGTQEDYCVAG